MNKFPILPVLEEIKNRTKSQFSEDLYLISVQHLLSTTGSLFEAILALGFKAQNIFLTGKIYSTHEETRNTLSGLGITIIESTYPKTPGTYAQCLESDVKQMWEMLRAIIIPEGKIIILDDGGFILRSIPNDLLMEHKIVGIEQTTSGTRMQPAFEKINVISVATSEDKVTKEPPIVAKAVRLKIEPQIKDLKPKAIGVVGFGNVGKAVSIDLSKDYKVYIFDINQQKNQDYPSLLFCQTLHELYNNVDIILGATGEDISQLSWLCNSSGDKTLISISSGDIEFNSILRASMPYLIEPYNDSLKTLLLRTSNGHLLRILRGGMVANFTGEADSGPREMIQMTRGLLLEAVIRAGK